MLLRALVRAATAASLVALVTLPSACSKAPAEVSSDFKPSEGTAPPSKLDIKDTLVGTGAEAKTGDTVKMTYTGTLMNGDVFDSNVGKDPFTFTIGKGQVIKGWDQGIPGMKVGGKRTLIIPPDLGYGANGSPPKIPGNAGLKFDVELLGVE